MKQSCLSDLLLLEQKLSDFKYNSFSLCIILLLTFAVTGCSTFTPKTIEEVPFRERAVTKEEGKVRVIAAVPSRKESAVLFGVDVGGEGIQPVWVRIENNDDIDYTFMPISLDPDHFSPNEVAWKNRFFMNDSANEAMAANFDRKNLSFIEVKAGETKEGFVYSNNDYGVKYFEVMLFHPQKTKLFDFVIEIPGLKTDYQQVDYEALNADGKTEVNAATLGEKLEALPCCVLGPDGKTPGDPLNIVVIGGEEYVFLPFVQRGWHVTETVSGGTVWNTVMSSVFNVYYRTSPISPLYLFGRPQDIALQKARESVDERNHLRLWLTPWRYNGKDVWVGQISRDIGVRLSSKTFVTHKIDPDVDEARDYLLTDLFLSGRLATYGSRPGVGTATRNKPRFNYTEDPYYTDGDRSVMILSPKQLSLDEILEINWKKSEQ